VAGEMMRVRADWTYGAGGPGLSTFYFKEPTGFDEGMAQDVADRVRAFFDVQKACYPTTTAISTQATVDILNPTTGDLVSQIVVATPPTDVTGTGTDGLASFTTCAVLSHSTTQFISGRRVTGRTFLGPLNKGAITGGEFSAGAQALVQGGTAELLDTAVTDAIPGVWHRPVLGTGGLFCPTAAYIVRPKLGVLRSRRD